MRRRGICLELFEANLSRQDGGPMGWRRDEFTQGIDLVLARCMCETAPDFVVCAWILVFRRVHCYVEAIKASGRWTPGGWTMIAAKDCAAALDCALSRDWDESVRLSAYYQLSEQIAKGA